MKKIASLLFSTLLSSFINLCPAQIWEPLNPPLNIFNGPINTTTVDASGKIFAAGEFTNSTKKYFVAQWDGVNWTEVGGDTASLNANGTIHTLTSFNDTIYAGGFFSNHLSKRYVAKWNGSTWSELGTGAKGLNANGNIYAVTVDREGNVYAAGAFTNSTNKKYVAKWDGSSWIELGAGTNALNADREIYSISFDSSGNLYAGGYFTNAVGKQYVARWNGTTWSELGTGLNALNANDYIGCVATDGSGNVYATGTFRNSNNEYYMAKWNGTSWSESGISSNAHWGNDFIGAISVKDENEIYVAGTFLDSSVGLYYVAHFNGTSWLPLSNIKRPWHANDRLYSLTVDANRNIFVGGKFLNKGGHSYVAHWNGDYWSELGDKGNPAYFESVNQLVGDSLGNLYVSGHSDWPVEQQGIHYWNGKSWEMLNVPDTSNLSLRLAGENKMLVDNKGILYVTGRKVIEDSSYGCVLQWDGLKWNVLEDFPNSIGTFNGSSIFGIKKDAHGHIYAYGSFIDSVHGFVSFAKWDGKSWQRLLGSSYSSVQDFCVANNGIIYAFGGFTNNVGRQVIASYDPATQTGWNEVNSDSTQLSVPGYNIFTALATDSKNNLYVNGHLTNTRGNRYLAKWDGTHWQELGVTNSLGKKLMVDKADNIYVNKDENSGWGDAVKKLNGSSWIDLVPQPDLSGTYTSGGVFATDNAGNLYTSTPTKGLGISTFIVKYNGSETYSPEITSFTPASGSIGTTVTIRGRKLTWTNTVQFGSTNAASFVVRNDSTITAVVAQGSTGSIVIKTTGGIDSIKSFTFTCDSVKGPVPQIALVNDSTLNSSFARYFTWYHNNRIMEGEHARSLRVKSAGFYRVATSADSSCWISSLDYPILINPGPISDSIKLNVYPNPSNGTFTAHLKLAQTNTTKVFVQIVDVSGMLIYQTSNLIFYGSEIRIPVTINSKGTFWVKVFVNNSRVQQSVIVL